MSGGLSMNENLNEPQAVTGGSADKGVADGPVLTLRQARERAGLHPVALAAMLKVPVRRLEALEAGRYDELPDMTFARALAQSVCRVLKVDPAPILASLPASAEVRLGDIEKSINAPMPARQGALKAMGATPLVGRRLSWPVAIALLVSVVAVVLWFLLPAAPTTASERVSVVSSATTPLPEPAATQGDTLGARAVAGQESAEPIVTPVPVAVAGAGPVVEAVADAVTTEAPVPLDGVFRLRAREAAWVQVVGASGRVLVQRSLQAGEVASFSADFPLTVVVGRADEVEATLRGEPFALAPLARNNVARFEVR